MRRCDCHTGTIVCAECGGVVAVAKRRPVPKVLKMPGRMKAPPPDTSVLRAYADKRDGTCVICLHYAPEPWELHHVDGGTGKTQRQTKRNTCKTHKLCHEKAHKGDLDALDALFHWAHAYGYGETETIIQRRIAKIQESRRAQRSSGTR